MFREVGESENVQGLQVEVKGEVKIVLIAGGF